MDWTTIVHVFSSPLSLVDTDHVVECRIVIGRWVNPCLGWPVVVMMRWCLGRVDTRSITIWPVGRH